MPLVVPRKVTFLAKSEYFTSPGIKGFFKKITFPGSWPGTGRSIRWKTF